jgi:hypothetical protein
MTLDQFIGWLVLAATDLDGSGLTELGESRRLLLAQLDRRSKEAQAEALIARLLSFLELLPDVARAAGYAVTLPQLPALPR